MTTDDPGENVNQAFFVNDLHGPNMDVKWVHNEVYINHVQSISPWIPAYTYTFHIVCCSKMSAFGLNIGISITDEKGCCAIDLEVDAMSQ